MATNHKPSDSKQANIGTAIAEAIRTVTFGTKEIRTEDSDGLIPSDFVGIALAQALEAQGFKRI